MTPHIEKVMPAGANRFGYESETFPVVIPFMGNILASAFMPTIRRNVIKLVIFIE